MTYKQRFTICQVLDLEGGFSKTIFPQVETLLQTEGFLQALKFVSKRKKKDSYNSWIDFLFVNLFFEYYQPCKRFYNGIGKPLKFCITEDQRVYYEKVMVHALQVAVLLRSAQKYTPWSYFSSVVKQSLKNKNKKLHNSP